MLVEKRNGNREELDVNKIHRSVEWACDGLNVSLSDIETGAHVQLFDGIKTEDIHTAMINSAATLIDIDKPDYEFVAARLLLQQIYKEVNGNVEYRHLAKYIQQGVDEGVLDPKLLTDFDLDALNGALVGERDFKFRYLGLKTIYDRYLIREMPKNGKLEGDIIEMPQHFWMRVAMGIALNEAEPTKWAIEFYHLLSTFQFVNSTPTLFNSGTNHPQMSSCYVTTVHDSIFEPPSEISGNSPLGRGIFSSITECALYSKFAGGVGADWTRVRPVGGHIKSTNGVSSGVVPYLKTFSDTSVAVNQGGKRAGSFAVYLEPWHGDIERFIDLKKPNGDERLRARELFPVIWVNDLFMERVRDKGMWSLFSPVDFPNLHELYGEKFKLEYEKAEASGKAIKVVDAEQLWRKIVNALAESGNPWFCFKDEMNRRNPQAHDGVIHSSNLCTEIALNTSDSESAVCNLGSINMAEISPEDFKRVVPVAMRMLDNVIDLNFYPTDKARRSNLRHRPVGLGVMGWSEYIAKRGIDWESNEHLKVTNDTFERLSYWAIRSSMELAIEKGKYETFEGSTWSRGILPVDTARLLPKTWIGSKEESTVEWDALRKAVVKNGMRNSNCLSIAPTATIANIVGTEACIEPPFKLVTLPDNKSGKFKIVAPSLRYNKAIKNAFDIDQTWIIKAAAVRQQYICQSQSVNLFKRKEVKGKELTEWYFLAWELGLKSTYYLKMQIEELLHEEAGNSYAESEEAPKFCTMEPGCESCQ